VVMEYKVTWYYGGEHTEMIDSVNYSNMYEDLKEEFSSWKDLALISVYDTDDNLIFTF